MTNRDGRYAPENRSLDAMRYGLLGEDASTTREKLEKFTGIVDWPYLEPHFESGVLLYVDPALEITAVGEAFAGDQLELVEGWLKSGDLVQPSQPHAAYWAESGEQFIALVVSPFVLIQPAAAGEGSS